MRRKKYFSHFLPLIPNNSTKFSKHFSSIAIFKCSGSHVPQVFVLLQFCKESFIYFYFFICINFLYKNCSPYCVFQRVRFVYRIYLIKNSISQLSICNSIAILLREFETLISSFSPSTSKIHFQRKFSEAVLPFIPPNIIIS